MSQECPQLALLSENVRKFWEEKQITLQDTLRRFSYAVLTLPSGVMTVEKGGILYLMTRNLWFEDFQKSSTFSSLFQSSSQYKKMLLQLPVGTIEQVQIVPGFALNTFSPEFPARSGRFQWFTRMFSKEPQYLCLAGKEASGQDVRYVFREVGEPEAWVQAITDRQ
jgi:hypothetical protein